jgi:hypothetical protein
MVIINIYLRADVHDINIGILSILLFDFYIIPIRCILFNVNYFTEISFSDLKVNHNKSNNFTTVYYTVL